PTRASSPSSAVPVYWSASARSAPGACWTGRSGTRCRGAAMTVYVDPARHPFGRMMMCHMMADTTEELLAMADRIGIARKWLQRAGTAYEHFDIAKSKRAMAIAAGAVEVDSRFLGQLIH